MNEEYLCELWRKCKHPHPKYGGEDMVWPMEFAEMIIKECMDATRGSITGLDAFNNIKQHFGVES